jgi:hypothetical protein
MRFAIDSGKLLYALGIAFAGAALLYFARDVVFDLSITVKAALLFVLFVACFLAGLVVERDVLDVVAFALAGLTYVVFVGYVVVRYGPSETGTFLLLAFSAVLFVGLGYLLRAGAVAVPQRRAVAVAGALLLVSVALVGVDAVGGDVTYEVTTESSVTVEPVETDRPEPYSRTQMRVGTVTASNDFVFTRALSLPALRGCVVGVEAIPSEEVWLRYEYPGYTRPNTIAGGATRTFPIVADLPVDANRTEPLTYAVERGSDCSVERAEPTLLVAVGERDR